MDLSSATPSSDSRSESVNKIIKNTALSVADCACFIDLEVLTKTLDTLAKEPTSTTDEVRVFIGQERAKSALEFGLGMPAKGYNLYVMGEQATGRATLVKSHIRKNIDQYPAPSDWLYLHNLKDERSPLSLELACSASEYLLKDMQQLINSLLDTFPAAFDNPGYQRKKSVLQKQYKGKYEAALESVEKAAVEFDIALFEEDGTVSFLPVVDNKPMDEEAFVQLPNAVQETFITHIAELEELLEEELLELPLWKRQQAKALRELKTETAEQSIEPLLADLCKKYADEPQLDSYFVSIKPHIIDSVLWLDELEEKEEKFDIAQAREYLESQYLPNVLVQHTKTAEAPVIYESNPTYQNLFGRIEYSTAQGSVMTDYRMISPGALHQANGGFLLLDADKMVEQPHVWESLKRALKQAQLRIDLPQQDAGMVNSVTLAPEPIALNVKLILIGSRELFYLLQEHDEEFSHLFRVLVDFAYELPATEHNVLDFVTQASAHARKLSFTHVEPLAMQMLLMESMRNAEHQQKICAQFADILELMNEAAFYAKAALPCALANTFLEEAKTAREFRTGRVAESLLDDIKEGQILIPTTGSAVGTINGLTVMDIGSSTFGTPARISATVHAGSNGVVDIEREVELGQSIHSKGVMLLTGYLGHKYAQHFPLTLSANIALEQSYGYIDGDSASLGELIALLSALTHEPCKQSIAITGSINQYGEVQSVGGINEKIEGFFAICEHRGLTGEQGVIIPYANAVHLMLNNAVRSAVAAGVFHIYAVKTVDEALTILMEKEAGEQNSKGRYPKHTVNYKALQQLAKIALIVNGGDEE